MGEETAKSPDVKVKIVGVILLITGKALIIVAETRLGRSTIRRELSDKEVNLLKAKDDLKVKLAYQSPPMPIKGESYRCANPTLDYSHPRPSRMSSRRPPSN